MATPDEKIRPDKKAPPDEKALLACLRLTRTENVGAITFHQLVRRFGSAEAALEALPDLAARGGLKRKLAIPTLQACKDELGALRQRAIHLVPWGHADYPPLLAQIADAPPLLLVRGHVSLLRKNSVAFVGARNASLNGRKMAENLARAVGEAGWVVTSGLAAGIDGAAHKGALQTGTIGVIAGGHDHIYPPENAPLYDALAEAGAIVTEMPLGANVKSHFFPLRNRIVSGLSRGVVVVEAAKKSGSLITARLASEQGREVMAVPGSPLDPRAGGTNHLIKEGATLIETAEDILSALATTRLEENLPVLFSPQPSEIPREDEIDAARTVLMNALSPTPTAVDELIRLCHLPSSIVWNVLLELELAGRISRLAGNRVALIA